MSAVVCSRCILCFKRASCLSSSHVLIGAVKNYSNSANKSFVGRDFINLKDFQQDDIKQILWTAKDLKIRIKENKENMVPLNGKTVSLLLDDSNIWTRLAAESAISSLGGHPAIISSKDAIFQTSDSVKESGRVLSHLSDIIVVETPKEDDLDILAKESQAPVISAGSNVFKPLQTLADFLTIQETFGYLRGAKLAWIGRGNNIAQSLMIGCGKLGIDLSMAIPPGYQPDTNVTEYMMKMSGKHESDYRLTSDPAGCVYRTDVIMVDAWSSGGSEECIEKRTKDFAGFKVTRKVLKEAGANWKILHSLPRQPEEITDDLFFDSNSLVWQSAENRKWTLMAVMLHVLQDYSPECSRPKFMRGE